MTPGEFPPTIYPQGADMPDRSSKQPKRGPGRPKGPAKQALYLEVPADVKQAMEVAAAEDRRSLTAEVTIALEEFLARRQARRQEGGAE